MAVRRILRTILLSTLAILAAWPAVGCSNGAYMKADRWMARRPADADLATLRAQFADAAVRIVYIYGLSLDPPASRRGGDLYETYAANLAHLRGGLGAEIRFIAMIGKQRPAEQILAVAQAFWGAGFDGVQLDYEPLASGSPLLPKTLALLRANKPRNSIVSVAMYMLEHPLLREPQSDRPQLRVWDTAYVASLIPLVDDVMVMNYDTNIRERADYVALTAAQTDAFTRLVGAAPVRLNIGLISNVSGRRGLYDRKAENLAAGLEGVRRVWPRCPEGRGVTVFAVAGATPADWSAIGEWARATTGFDRGQIRTFSGVAVDRRRGRSSG